MSNDRVYLYPYSAEEAERRGELSLWRESHRENVRCAASIEDAIRRSFDGLHLDCSCADEVIAKYGYKRVNFVLANTLQQLKEDGRFSMDNKDWSRRTFIPPDEERNRKFVVTSHPAVLNGFVNLFRKAMDSLGLYGTDHCDDTPDGREYEGKVLVLSADTLREKYWQPKYQLWYAHDGFGCSPNTIGRSIRSTCLADGEQTRWNRSDFVGVLKEEHLPDWARERLEVLQHGGVLAPEQSDTTQEQDQTM